MSSARANRDDGHRRQRVDPAPLRSAQRAAKDASGGQEIVPLSTEVQQRLVLRVLVEEFGGEVSGSALARHLARRFGWTQPALGPRLADVLQTLHGFDALDLEANGDGDFIVRLLPEGAGLAHDLTDLNYRGPLAKSDLN